MFLETLPMNLLVLEACHVVSDSWKNLVPNFQDYQAFSQADLDTSDESILALLEQI